jgi:hypothetical protein
MPAMMRTLAGLSLVSILAWCGGCTTQEGDTIVVNGLDCGLVRADMAGNWSVTYVADSATTVNCDNPAEDNATVSVGAGTVIYANAVAFPGAAGATFTAIAAGPNALPDELVASIEADSCLALVQIWNQGAHGWVQCVGTLDRNSHLIGGICDAIDLDTNSDGTADTACDLSHSLVAAIGTP